MLKDQCGVNIDKDTGDIAFITYEKGEAEAKVGLILYLMTFHRSNIPLDPFQSAGCGQGARRCLDGQGEDRNQGADYRGQHIGGGS